MWRITLARSAHLLFYVLLVLQPTSGYLSSSFSGYDTKWWGIPLPSWGWRDPPLNEFFTEIHVMSSVLFLVLIVLMVIKFVLVAGYFMHLKFDSPLFTNLFTAGLILAMAVYLVALTAFRIWD